MLLSLQSLFYSIIFVSVIPANCRHIPETPPEIARRNATPCSIEMDQICSTIDVSNLYSMRFTVDSFHHSGEIKGYLAVKLQK